MYQCTDRTLWNNDFPNVFFISSIDHECAVAAEIGTILVCFGIGTEQIPTETGYCRFARYYYYYYSFFFKKKNTLAKQVWQLIWINWLFLDKDGDQSYSIVNVYKRFSFGFQNYNFPHEMQISKLISLIFLSKYSKP